MHPFHPRWPADLDGYKPPMPWSSTYRDALDIIAHAELDHLSLWRTHPEIWHLDAAGEWQCASRDGTGSSVRSFLDDWPDMLDCRSVPAPKGHRCPDYWVIVEPRRRFIIDPPDEHDVAAFVHLRARMATAGICLLDDVIIDDTPRWWSLHELVTGTTAWTFDRPTAATHAPSPKRRTRRLR